MMDNGQCISCDCRRQAATDCVPFTATYAHTLHSPPIPSPVKFRGPSYKDACDHSEAFLFSYDIHRRLEGQRPPRIIMNPAVKVAYSLNWYRWRNTILQIPFVRFWQSKSSPSSLRMPECVFSDWFLVMSHLCFNRDLEPWTTFLVR